MSPRLEVRHDRLPIRGSFTISRGSRTHADLVVVELVDGEARGRGECVPYPRYGESVESVLAQIEEQRPLLAAPDARLRLQEAMKPGAARNALDCALWDLEAKRAGRRVWDLLGAPAPDPLVTVFTLSLGTPESMAAAASEAASRPLLKVKLGGEGDIERIRAVREAAPEARLVVDANEAWTPDQVEPFLAAMAECGVEMVEQPLPAGKDEMLSGITRVVPVGADESAHDAAGLEKLVGRYDVVNLKLDKTGGLTGALAFVRRAEELGLDLMVGCMLGSSLGMAPAILVAQHARFVDVDGPLLLAEDRTPGLRYDGSTVHPPEAALWG
ncbi:N-acetyl-D-Glu racemase DgcA [Marinimicrococcus flavescens]|uniref:N-acetyl-D-Glu racemase DgcA n=1 Tax=Marinimicrococcus flavescens TaxID=3031815 RepID=UPI002E16F64E